MDDLDPAPATSSAPRSATVEFVGSALLTLAVVSTSFGAALFPGRGGVAAPWLLVAVAAATTLVLLSLLLPGGRFHPLLTLVDLRAGSLPARAAALVVLAQILGAALGCVLGFWAVRGIGGVALTTAGMQGTRIADVLFTGALGGLVIGLAGVLSPTRRGSTAPPAAHVVALATAFVALSVDRIAVGNPAIALARVISPSGLNAGLPFEQALLLIGGHLAGLAVALLIAPLLARD